MTRKIKDATAVVAAEMLVPVEQLQSDMDALAGIDVDGMSDEELLALLAAADEEGAVEPVVEHEGETIAETVLLNTTGAADDEPVEERLQDLIDGVSKAEAQERSEETAAEFDDRSAYEAAMNPANDSKPAKLKGYKAKMITLPLATVMIAANVSPDFINRSVTEGRRYNIYAIDKMNDLLAGLATGAFRNAINIAVMKSMLKFRAAGMVFNGVATLAAASDKVKVEHGMSGLLVRHTVSAATAPTQSSSTMNALQTMGIVANKGSVKFPIWELRDTPAARRAEEILLAA